MFYNNQRSGYEEIKSYYPVWYTEIKEMDAIFQLAGEFLDDAADQMEKVILNRYISTMDETALDETIQYLNLDGSLKTVEEKRRALLAAWNGSGKINGSIIKRIIKTFMGNEVEAELVLTDILTIIIHKNQIDEARQKDLFKYMATRLPAHLAIACEYHSTIELKTNLYVAPLRMDVIQITAQPYRDSSMAESRCELKIGAGILEHIKLEYRPE